MVQRSKGTVGRPDDDDQHRNPERATHLTGGLVHGTAYREALGWKARYRRRAEHREGEADPEPGDQCPRQPPAEVLGVKADLVANQTRPPTNTENPVISTRRNPNRAAIRPAVRTPAPPPAVQGLRRVRPSGSSSARRS